MSNFGFRGYRTISQHLNDLKKENFSLKLRIYFLEEKIQQKFEASSDDVHRRNIELKVEVESLKKELQDKQELLDEAVSTAESLSTQNEAELQRRLAERQEEISHVQQVLQTKVQLLQEEAELAREKAQQMASVAASEAERCLALEREMQAMGDSDGPCNCNTGTDTDGLIEELMQQKHSLGLQVEELQVKVHDLSSSLMKSEREAERLVGEQQDQLGQYESATGRCVAELQKAQNQVCSLHAKIRESESRNQKQQERLAEMELELRSAREEAQQQERNTQNLNDVLNSKEAEAAELCQVIDEQNRMLCSLRELAGRSQLQQLQVSGAETGRGQAEVLALQASLFQAQLELQAGQRLQRQAARAQEDQSRALQRLEKDLQGSLLHRRETERHNQELQLALQRVQSALQEKEEQLRKPGHDRSQADMENERTIRELRTSLQTKEQLLEQYSEMLEDLKEPRDSLLQKLRQRIKERDHALEKAVDDRFRCVEEKEEATRHLQLLIRERDKDLERQRCVLTNNEETIASLEMLVRGKALQLEQVSDAWRSAQQQRRDLEDRQGCALKEKDGVIKQLQTALQALTQEAQGLRSSLLAQVHSIPGDIMEELKLRLQLKDRLLQEVLADRTHQAQQHEEQVQDLLRSINCKDQYIQESAAQLSQVIAEQTSRLQELRRQLGCGFGPNPDSEADLGVELQALKEELSLALRREKESEERSRSQVARINSLCRTVHVKEEIIGDFQRQLADPSHLPLVERLTQEVQELRETLVQLDSLSRGSVRPSGGSAEFGGGDQRSGGQFA